MEHEYDLHLMLYKNTKILVNEALHLHSSMNDYPLE